MSDRAIIYTAIAGGYDNLKPPMNAGEPEQDRSLRIAFVDNPVICAGVDCPGWQIQQMSSISTDPLMQSKRYKVLAHEVLPPGTEFSLWVDGSMEFSSRLHPGELARLYLADADLALFKHPIRDCLYDEAHRCDVGKMDDSAVIARQMNRYRAEGYPRNNGLAECCVILRRHTPAVARLNEMWWKEIAEGSRRDQLSFGYVCWKLGMKYALFPGTRYTVMEFKTCRHIKPRNFRRKL
jgi:hypothetical protein